MADTKDLKSFAARREGSSPSTPTNLISYAKMINAASLSSHPKHKHAAFVFHNGECVGWANNKENHHAEIRALEVAKLYGYVRGLILLSIRIGKEGKLKLAKPCLSCFMYAKRHGVTMILYSTDKQSIIKMKEEK